METSNVLVDRIAHLVRSTLHGAINEVDVGLCCVDVIDLEGKVFLLVNGQRGLCAVNIIERDVRALFVITHGDVTDLVDFHDIACRLDITLVIAVGKIAIHKLLIEVSQEACLPDSRNKICNRHVSSLLIFDLLRRRRLC